MISLNHLLQIVRKRSGRIEKRFRFVLTSLVLTALILISTFFPFTASIVFIPLLFLVAYLLTYFCLLEGIEGMSWFGLFVMPIMVTIAFYFFYFLFPARWLTRLPFAALYAISIYAMLLCSNIFNVGVEKSLQLYRAAFSINFFYHAVITFFIFNLIFSLQQIFLINAVLVGVVGSVLSLHLFWTIKLNKHLEPEILRYALLTGGVLTELAIAVSFLPLKISIYALFLTAGYYSLSGLMYNYIDQRLFKETIREYVIVFIFVTVITLLSLSW